MNITLSDDIDYSAITQYLGEHGVREEVDVDKTVAELDTIVSSRRAPSAENATPIKEERAGIPARAQSSGQSVVQRSDSVNETARYTYKILDEGTGKVLRTQRVMYRDLQKEVTRATPPCYEITGHLVMDDAEKTAIAYARFKPDEKSLGLAKAAAVKACQVFDSGASGKGADELLRVVLQAAVGALEAYNRLPPNKAVVEGMDSQPTDELNTVRVAGLFRYAGVDEMDDIDAITTAVIRLCEVYDLVETLINPSLEKLKVCSTEVIAQRVEDSPFAYTYIRGAAFEFGLQFINADKTGR